MKKAALLLLLVGYIIGLTAQESFLRHYAINNGLPSSETYAAFQDKKGFIWIASDMGVSRFDGYNFKVFTTADGLTDNTVFRFFEDHAGRIWFYTFSGRLSYFLNDSIYGKDFAINEQIHNFLGSGFINNMQVDLQDTVWFATSKGLVKIIPSTQQGKRVWKTLAIVTDKPTFLTRPGYITIQSYAGERSLVKRYMPYSRVDSVILPRPASDFVRIFKAKGQAFIVEFSSSMVWVNANGDTHLFDNQICVLDVVTEGDSSVWLSKSHSGVQLFNGPRFTRPQISLLHDLSVTDILKDREGGYWFTTLEDGVFYMPSAQFRYINTEQEKWDNNQAALGIIRNGKISILTSKGLYDWTDENTLKPLLSPGGGTLIPNLATRYLNTYSASNGELWLSTNIGTAVIDTHLLKMTKLIKMSSPEKPIVDSRILYEDHNRNIWSLNHNSLTGIDINSKQIIKTLAVPSRAEALCEDPHGFMLVGTLNGLYKLQGDTFIFLGNQNPLFKNRIVDINKRGSLVACATRGAGLLLIKDDSIYIINKANGLKSDMCRSVFIDNDRTIWLATNNGLSALYLTYNPFKSTINNYSATDGLPSNDIEQVAKVDSLIWVLTKKGIASFDPNRFFSNNYPPPVYITQLKIDNVLKLASVDTALSHLTNFIGIDYVGLSYKSAGKQQYKYILQGYDTGWTYTTNTFVQFTKLPPGNYKFMVLCINHAGIASTQPAVYSFTINTPYYRRWWFAIFFAIACIGAVVVGAIIYVRRIREREEQKTELNRKISNLELQALRAQMNPHFIFNCLNAIQDFIIKNDADAAKRYLTSFSKLIRKTLENSRRQSIRLTDEIDFLNLYLELERMRFVDKFGFKIVCEPGLENKYLQIPSMVLQPFIENAVRHSRIGSLATQGELNISFSMGDKHLVCVIDDNGIGLNQSLKLKGEQTGMREVHALDIINERVKSMNEVYHSNISYTIIDKADKEINSSGTRVEIHIPME